MAVVNFSSRNEMTKTLFNLIATKSDIFKIRSLIESSNGLKKAGLSISIDFSATSTVNVEKPGLEENYKLLPLAFAAFFKHTSAMNCLLEQGLDVNEGNPSPLWCAIYSKLDIRAVEKLIDHGADVNGVFDVLLRNSVRALIHGTGVNEVSTLYLCILYQDYDKAKLLLLFGYVPTKDDLEELDAKIKKLHSTELVKSMRAMCIAATEIRKAQDAYVEGSLWHVWQHIAAACASDAKFFLDFLGNEIRLVNLDVYSERFSFPPKHILDFLELFATMAQKTDPASFKHFQEQTLLEIEGHDADANPGLFFDSNEAKHAWFTHMSAGREWHQTVQVMNNNNNNQGMNNNQGINNNQGMNNNNNNTNGAPEAQEPPKRPRRAARKKY